MTNEIQPVPAGYPSVIPYLAVAEADAVLAFLQATFAAETIKLSRLPNGRIANAELRVGDAVVLLTEGRPGNFTPASLYCYLADVDGAYARALAAGATSLNPPEQMFYGDYVAGVRDAGGNQWWFARRTEEVSATELSTRMAELRGTQA